MTDSTGAVARRYAEAAFAVAEEQKDLRGWERDLATFGQILTSPEVAQLFSNPRLDDAKRAALASAVVPDDTAADRKNFVKLVVLNGRVGAIAEIRREFDALVAESEGRVDVEVTTATEPDTAARKQITDMLAERTGRETRVDIKVDARILGGLIVRQGDRVTDGSVRRRLAELRQQLLAG